MVLQVEANCRAEAGEAVGRQAGLPWSSEEDCHVIHVSGSSCTCCGLECVHQGIETQHPKEERYGAAHAESAGQGPRLHDLPHDDGLYLPLADKCAYCLLDPPWCPPALDNLEEPRPRDSLECLRLVGEEDGRPILDVAVVVSPLEFLLSLIHI
eukprot:1283715-Prorocentrum_lima.AAC.1